LNLYTILPLFAFIANLTLGLYGFYLNPKKMQNVLFLIFTFLLAIWSLGHFMTFLSNSTAEAIANDLIANIGSILSSYFVLFFIFSYTNHRYAREKIIWLLFFLFPLSLTIVALTTDLMTVSAEASWWGYRIIDGPLNIIVGIYNLLYICIGLIILYRYCKENRNTSLATNARLLGISILFPLIAGTITQILFPLLDINIIPLTTSFTIITAFTFCYVLHRSSEHTSYKLSLRKRIAAVVVILIIVCGMSTLIPGYVMSRSGFEREVLTSLSNDANSRAEHIQSFINDQKQIALFISTTPLFVDLFKDYTNEVSDINTSDYTMSLLDTIVNVTDDIQYIEFLAINGTILYKSNETCFDTTRNISSFIHSSNNITVGNVSLCPWTQKPVLNISAPMVIDNTLKGFVIFRINIETLYHILTRNIDDDSLEFILVNNDGILISPSRFINDSILKVKIGSENFIQSLWQSVNANKMTDHNVEAFYYTNYRGASVLGIHVIFDDIGWVLIAERNADEIATISNYMILMFIAIFALLLFIGVFIAIILSRILSRPLHTLMNATQKISEGNLDVSIPVEGKDEIGQLARTFNNMTKRLKQSRDEIERINESLEDLVEKRTHQLSESKKELQETVRSLTDNKLALLNLTSDMKDTINQLHFAQRSIEEKNQELKKAKESLETMNEMLEQKVSERTTRIQQLLKQKDEFIGQLGHDLKNPLGPLINLLPLLEKKAYDERDKEIFKVLRRNVNYMKNLVTKTLELARLNSPNTKLSKEPLSLKHHLEEILHNNTMIFEQKHMHVINNISDDLMILGDKLRLEELFNNLINNAVKYSNDHDTLTITADQQDDVITLAIQDTGMGMSKEQLERLFDEFYKADSSRHDFDSSGLGLTIAKKIVEKHGGTIWAESKGLGKGSTFYVRLPHDTSIEVDHRLNDES